MASFCNSTKSPYSQKAFQELYLFISVDMHVKIGKVGRLKYCSVRRVVSTNCLITSSNFTPKL